MAQKTNELKMIFNNIKIEILSKDKKRIIDCLKNILIIILVAIIIKVPFIFLRTVFLDFLNGADIAMNIQNILGYVFELSYILIALIYIFKRLKSCFIKKA